jgi:predicted transcriptional regulator
MYTNYAVIHIAPYKKAAYEQAVSFRKRGFTYSEIAKICNVSKATVSNWLRHEDFSQVVSIANKKRAITDNKKRLALINKARVTERQVSYAAAKRVAATEFKHYRHSPLFIAGITAYMTSGDLNTPHQIRVSSANVVTQQIIIAFVKEFLGVDRSDIHVWLSLSSLHDEVICMKWWIRKTGVLASSFYKNQIISTIHRGEPLHFGVLNTIIGSTLLKTKLTVWVSLFKKELKIR